MKKLLFVFAFFCFVILKTSISSAQNVPIFWPPELTHCCSIDFDELSYCARDINGEAYYKQITWSMSPGTSSFSMPDLLTGGHDDPIEYVIIDGVRIDADAGCFCMHVNGCCYQFELTGDPNPSMVISCFPCSEWLMHCLPGSTSGRPCK